ncbi:MAG: discoidin domain-containing protein, partial [Niameybacter sp.]
MEKPGEDYSGEMLFDSNLNTYWEAQSKDGASITITLNEARDIKKLEITPYINEQLNGSIASYKLQMGASEDSLEHVAGGSFYTK